MDAAPPPPNFGAMLTDLAELGLRIVKAVATAAEADQTIIKLVTAVLPNPAHQATSLAEATAAGADIDNAAAILATATPRIEIFARAYDRLARSIRRTIALHRRLESGWTGARAADTRAAMQKRQVKAAIVKKIRDHSDAEPNERLFDDLNEQLDDPGLDEEIAATSIEAVIERIAADIGLVVAACTPFLHPTHSAEAPNPIPHPPDTG